MGSRKKSKIPEPPPPPPIHTLPTQGSAPLKVKASPPPPLADAAEKKTPPPSGKPAKPQAAPKPSRLVRAFSSGTMTLPSFRKRSKNESKKSDGKKRNSDVSKPDAATLEKEEDTHTTPTAQLREAPLWKLPGMPVNRRHSSVNLDRCAVVTDPKSPPGLPSDLPPRPKTPPVLPVRLKTPPAHRSSTPPNLTSPPKAPPGPPAEPPPRPPSPAHELPTIAEVADAVSLESDRGRLVHSASAGAIISLPDSTPTDSEQPPATSTPIPEDDADLEDVQAKGTSSPQVLSESFSEVPPPLPEKPASRKVSSNAPKPTVVSIRQLVRKHSSSFPLRIKVLQGYCSDNSEINMSTDDVYNIHVVKHTKVVTIRDEDQVTCRIPLTSTMKFGLIYDPNGKYEEGLNGYKYSRVGDIMVLPTLPKVVCATKAFEGSEGKSSVQENEILIVKRIQKSKFKKGKRGIKVFSLLTKSEKFLQDDCHAKFSTKPSLVRMHLPDILECVSHPFPSHAVMYSTSDDPSHLKTLPGTLSRVVTLSNCTIETSLEASAVDATEDENLSTSTDSLHGDQQEEEKPTLFHIPLDDEIAEIEVAVLSSNDTDGKPNHLSDIDAALTGSQSLDISQLQAPKYSSSDLAESEASDTQAMLTQPAQQGCGDTGVKLEPPYVNISDSFNMLNEIGSQNDDNDSKDGYDTIGVHLLKGQPGYHYDSDHAPPTAPEDIESEYDSIGFEKFGISDPRLSCMIENLEHISQSLGDRIANLESKEAPTELTMMQSMLEKLSVKLDSVDTQLATLASAPLPSQLPETSQQSQKPQQPQAPQLPQASQEPPSSQLPQASQEPPSSQQPQASQEPPSSQQPQASQEPPSSQLPQASQEPPSSQQPQASQEPPSSQQPQPSAAPTAARTNPVESSPQANKEYLSTLDEGQMLMLLDAMDLSQYRENFQREHVTGEVLVECDENVLQQELGIASKIHRIRLMKIVNGQRSVYEYLK